LLSYSIRFRVFATRHLNEFLAESDQKIRTAIEQEEADHIINVDENEYMETLIRRFSVSAPQLNFDKITVTDYEREASGSRYPGIFPNSAYKVQVITFHIPYTGDATLLKYQPSQHYLWSTEVSLENQNLCFEIANPERNTEQVKTEKQRAIDMMKDMLNTLVKDIEEYNQKLPGLISKAFKARKNRLMDNKKMLNDLL